ncbi:hypothetical protein [Tuberibacillus sp. Marseille-P3662]|uniref:hypothetical protein n=1 Tax=Tuberibacillus sp. Marseille-P3662 TaxID=1965358 RepID=UPI000A1C8E0D|nr:hypothetical protein [Tuberibacillus sp. Marseille-P3662]
MNQQPNQQYMINSLSGDITRLTHEKAYCEAIIAEQQQEFQSMKQIIAKYEEPKNAEAVPEAENSPKE